MLALLTRPRAGWLCLVLAGAYLVVGWWPFDPTPRNRVSWLAGRPGLEFRPPGIAVDRHLLPWSAAGTAGGFSLELQLDTLVEPRTSVTQLLTLHEAGRPSNLSVCQWKSELILRLPDPASPRGYREAAVDGLQRKPQVVTITCGPGGTTFYLDGRPAVRYPRFLVRPEAVRGRLILGDAAEGKHAWTGRILGVAIVHRVLESAEVARRHRAWVAHDAALLAREPAPVVLYLFDEGAGRQATSRMTPMHRLEIPVDYEVLEKTPLSLTRDMTALVRRDARDTFVNLAGFVPLGLLVFHFLRLGWPGRPLAAAGMALVAGAGLSFVIEIGQIWLPTRVSSATDLMLNTAGTLLGIGVGLFLRPSALATSDTLRV